MDEVNPAKLQYFMFSVIVAFVLSFLINFFAIDIMKNSFLYGFPMSLKDAEGAVKIFSQLVNTAFMGIFIIPFVYFFAGWLQSKGI